MKNFKEEQEISLDLEDGDPSDEMTFQKPETNHNHNQELDSIVELNYEASSDEESSLLSQPIWKQPCKPKLAPLRTSLIS